MNAPDKDAALELRLKELNEALPLEKDPLKFALMWKEFSRIHAQRSPETVARMEKDRGLA